MGDSGALSALDDIDLSYVTDAGALAQLSTVGSDQIDDDAITNAKIAVDAIQGDVIAAGAITSTMIGEDAVTTAAIANDAITNDLIAAGAITETEISDDSITTVKIAANAITATEIAAGAVTATEIAANTITAGQIAAGAVSATEIAANTITSAQIAANTVTASEIAANAITATEIAAGTISAAEIAADTITANEIATGAISTDEIAAGAITTATIAAGAVTADEIAANTVTAAQIAADTISSNEIASGAITTNELAAGAVTANEIAANSITAGQIAAGAISATELAADAVTADKIATGALQADEITGDVSEHFNFALGQGIGATSMKSLSSTKQTFDVEIPAPSGGVAKRAYIQGVAIADTNDVTGFDFTLEIRLKTGKSYTHDFTGYDRAATAPYGTSSINYNIYSGNQITDLALGGVWTDYASNVVSVHGFFYDESADETYLLFNDDEGDFQNGDWALTPSTSTSAASNLCLPRFGAPANGEEHTVPFIIILPETTVATTFMITFSGSGFLRGLNGEAGYLR